MIPTCSQCSGSNLKSIELVYSQNTDSYGYPRNDIGRKLAPPEKASYVDAVKKYWFTWPAIWVGLLAVLDWAEYWEPPYIYGVTAFSFLIALSIIIRRLVIAYKRNSAFQSDYNTWARNFHCGNCGHIQPM